MLYIYGLIWVYEGLTGSGLAIQVDQVFPG
jgi:hypothetical protein